MPKYIRKYRGSNGEWVYVYRPVGSKGKAEHKEQIKKVTAYNKQRVATYSIKPDFVNMPTEDLIREYIESGNDLDRFTTIAKMDAGKMLQFKAQNRQESVRNELERRGDYFKLTKYIMENPMRKAVVIFTPSEMQALDKAKKDGHLNPDNTFKGGFKGCTAHQKGKGLSEESARKLCAYIGRRAGKIK